MAELAVAAAVIATAVFSYGGSHPAYQAPALAGLFAGWGLLRLANRARPVISSAASALVAAAALAVPLLWCVPVPMSLLDALSPRRAWWVRQVHETAEAAAAWGSLSHVPSETAFRAVSGFAYAFFGLWLFRLFSASALSRKRFVGFLFLLGSLQALYGLYQVLAPLQGTSRPVLGMAHGSFINRNHYAAFLGMVWPVLAAFTAAGFREPQAPGGLTAREGRWERRHKTLLGLFATGFVLLALVFSRSRGGIVSAAAAATVLVLSAGSRKKTVTAAVAACWLVLLSYGAMIGFDEILARFDRLENDAPGRFRLWEDTWRMLRDHPWTGVGPGAFQEAHKVYQDHLLEPQFAGHAHNDYLEWTAEWGWPAGLAGIGALWGLWIYGLLRVVRARRRSPAAETSLAAGALAGTAALMLHAWVDFPFRMGANALVFWALAALAAAEIRTMGAPEPAHVSHVRPSRGRAMNLHPDTR
ncbi:MAG: O-antigen ligase family protein [Desulfosoma sp.]